MQLKKILSVFLVVALIASLCSLSAVAVNNDVFKVGVEAETATPISSSPNIIKTGEVVTITIKALQNTGVDYLSFKVSYDINLFEFVGIVPSTGKFHASETITPFDGYIKYFTYDVKPIETVGEMFKFTLKAKEDICGDAAVTAALIQNNPSNCALTVNGVVKDVPFTSDSYTTAIHKINAEGIVTAPKCEAEGYTTYTCDICSGLIKGNTVPAINHKAANPVKENIINSTCYALGSYNSVVYCANEGCGIELSRVNGIIIEKIPHTPADAVMENVVDTTCYSEGSYDSVVYCSVSDCKAELSRVEDIAVEKIAHTPAAATKENVKDSTCYAEGSYDEVVYCAVAACKHEISRVAKTIPVKAHTSGEPVRENVVPATCWKLGSFDEVVYCTVAGCKAEISRTAKVLQMNDHTAATAVRENVIDATCYSEGSYDEVVYCAFAECHYEISKVEKTIEKKAHTPATAVQENFKDSTCTAEGSYDEVVYCAVAACKHEISRVQKTVDKKAHTPAAAVQENFKDSTCTAEGSYDEVVYCSVCKTELSRTAKVVEKKAHNWGEATVVAPQYKVEGYSIHTCKDCKFEEKFDIVPALTYLLGDVNANEVIDDTDAIYLLYATLGMEGYTLNQTADFNGDGEVTDADAIHLLYFTLFGAEDYPLADMKEAK